MDGQCVQVVEDNENLGQVVSNKDQAQKNIDLKLAKGRRNVLLTWCRICNQIPLKSSFKTTHLQNLHNHQICSICICCQVSEFRAISPFSENSVEINTKAQYYSTDTCNSFFNWGITIWRKTSQGYIFHILQYSGESRHKNSWNFKISFKALWWK